MSDDIRQDLQSHLSSLDLDIRKSKNARFMDQKVTPDVLCFIADCIVNYVAGNKQKVFSIQDIWQSQYLVKNVPAIFGKPSPKNKSAKSEYDKFVAQPIKALAYAGILRVQSSGKGSKYSINRYDLLEFISIRERNARIFLFDYLIKVLSDSNYIQYLNEFRKKHSDGKLKKQDLQFLKMKFQSLIIGNTPVTGVTEVNRIFPKVLNPIAVEWQTPGTEKGRLSKDVFLIPQLMYNRKNFRDKIKDKSKTRREARGADGEELSLTGPKYIRYRTNKAVELIRKKYTVSEVEDEYAGENASYVHHIFPQGEFPELAYYLENLIKITAEQHFGKAHPKGSTTIINREYQLVCLIAKLKSIETSLRMGEFYYTKEAFIHVVNTGLNIKLNSSLDFQQIKKAIIQHYNS